MIIGEYQQLYKIYCIKCLWKVSIGHQSRKIMLYSFARCIVIIEYGSSLSYKEKESSAEWTQVV